MKHLILTLLLVSSAALADDAGSLYCSFGSLGATTRDGSCELFGNMSGIAYRTTSNKTNVWASAATPGAIAINSMNPPNLQARKPILQSFAVSNSMGGSATIEGCDPLVNTLVGSCRLGAIRIPSPEGKSVLAVRAKISMKGQTVQIIPEAADAKAVASAICTHLGYGRSGSVSISEPFLSPGRGNYPTPHSLVQVALYPSISGSFRLIRVGSEAGRIKNVEEQVVSVRGYNGRTQDVVLIPNKADISQYNVGDTVLMPVKQVQCD